MAANQKGIELVLEMVDHYGLYVVQAYMRHVQDAAEEAVRNSLRDLSFNKGLKEVDTVTAIDYLDQAAKLNPDEIETELIQKKKASIRELIDMLKETTK